MPPDFGQLASLPKEAAHISAPVDTFVDRAVSDPLTMQSAFGTIGFSDWGRAEIRGEEHLNPTTKRCAEVIIRAVESDAVGYLRLNDDVQADVEASPEYQDLVWRKQALEPWDPRRHYLTRQQHFVRLQMLTDAIADITLNRPYF